MNVHSDGHRILIEPNEKHKGVVIDNDNLKDIKKTPLIGYFLMSFIIKTSLVVFCLCFGIKSGKTENFRDFDLTQAQEKFSFAFSLLFGAHWFWCGFPIIKIRVISFQALPHVERLYQTHFDALFHQDSKLFLFVFFR